MRIFCCFTPAHEVLFRKIFLPSVPARFEVEPTEIALEGHGDFLSPEFLQCIKKKIDLVLKSITDHRGEVIVWSDVDIRFFKISPDALESALGQREIVFQKESPRLSDVNTGFFVCRCTEPVSGFFHKVAADLERHGGENEQMVINRILREGSGDLSWGYLPASYYARTHGWPPPRSLALYHANYTKGADGVGQKLSQFQEMERIRQGGLPAWLWSIARRVPGHFRRS